MKYSKEDHLEIGCGTKLPEKGITLAGETASVGYYNDESNFYFEEIRIILDSREWIPTSV